MNEDSLFQQLIDLPLTQWSVFLDKQCVGNAELRSRLEQRCRMALAGTSLHTSRISDENATQSLEGSEEHALSGSFPEVADLAEGTVIAGKYRLLQTIGEGGMGSVWRAQQTEPIKRSVAIKLIKAGMDSRQVLARFEAERQALALMDHPNIARVYDGGVHQGRPYFVMEHVRGVPITEYCDRNRLTTGERLKLFVMVCNAIQHAHQKGIIHRDIKPSNVLVATFDDQPAVKVIDFGVAKAIGQSLTELSIHTGIGGIVGTPQYMSPEQATLNSDDIDTRSDVYALGILLYELLTGAPPFSPETLREKGLLEMLRVVREDEPPRPSARLSSADTLASLAAIRGSEPRSLTKLLKYELDWVVMKALEKDRKRRYETANGLAFDIQRYLAGEPVLAHPPSGLYRLTKFVKRHRAQVAATALVGLAVLGGLISTSLALAETIRQRNIAQAATQAEKEAKLHVVAERDEKEAARAAEAIQRQRAQDEQAIADQVNSFLQNDLLAESAPERNARDEKITVEELVEKAAERISGRFDDRPTVEAAIRLTIGNAFVNLGNLSAAQPHFDRAAELYRKALGEEDPKTLDALGNSAVLRKFQGKYTEAEPLYKQVLAARLRVLGPDHEDTLSSMNNLAMLYLATDRLESAEPLFVDALEGCRRTIGREHRDTLQSMNNLAMLYERLQRIDKAQALFLETLEIRRRVFGEDHLDTLVSMSSVANFYQNQNQPDKAEPYLAQIVDISSRVQGDEHPTTLIYKHNLANFYRKRSRLTDAEALHQKTLEARTRLLGRKHTDTLFSLNGLGLVYLDAENYVAAEPLFREAFETQREILGSEHAETLNYRNSLAIVFFAQGKFVESRSLLEESVAIARRKQGIEHMRTQDYLRNLIDVYEFTKEFAQGAALANELVELVKAKSGADSTDYLKARLSLARYSVRQGQWDVADGMLAECEQLGSRTNPDGWLTNYARAVTGWSKLAQQDYAAAESQLLKGYRGMQQEKNPSRVAKLRLAETVDHLVQLYEAQNKTEEVTRWQNEQLKYAAIAR